MNMKTYIGTKVVLADPMNKAEFERSMGNEYDGEDQEGYLVEYEDSYVSWSPKNVFENSYRKLRIGEAQAANRGTEFLNLHEEQKAWEKDISKGKEPCSECIGTELKNLLNKHGIDKDLGVPDFILADWLLQQLNTLDSVVGEWIQESTNDYDTEKG